jgi:hypothetical protein
MNLPAIFGVLNALMIFTEARPLMPGLMKVITDAIVATRTHDNAVILDRFAREGDWDAFISDRDELDGKGQIVYLHKGTRFYVDASYNDGTALIHVEGSPSPLWISILDLNYPATATQ